MINCSFGRDSTAIYYYLGIARRCLTGITACLFPCLPISLAAGASYAVGYGLEQALGGSLCVAS